MLISIFIIDKNIKSRSGKECCLQAALQVLSADAHFDYDLNLNSDPHIPAPWVQDGECNRAFSPDNRHQRASSQEKGIEISCPMKSYSGIAIVTVQGNKVTFCLFVL